ncbi:MAG TPA: nucleotidyltransferase domain-containing protein [Polyangiaceae bacterium]|nr:nucleotidyltransferase domain-containing protein [Polyangiaceae bacterium]
MEHTDFATLRRRVVAVIEADLAREDEEAAALRSSVLPKVAAAVAEARREGRCGQVWLFGSFAWGRPTEGSDVDLLVAECDNPDELAASVWRRAERPVHVISVDKAPDTLVQRVLAEGHPL